MKRLGFVLVLMLVIVALLVVGCEEEEAAAPTPTPTATPAATPTPTPTATPTPSATLPPGELSDLLGLTSAIESLKYDSVTTLPGIPQPVSSTVWHKGRKLKSETSVFGQDMIIYTDYDAQAMCMYNAAAGIALAQDFSAAPPNPLDQAATIVQFQPISIGSETVDGEDCLVFEWAVEGVTTKWWVAKDDGFPRRIEITLPEGTMTMEFTNVEFVDIPDSVFEFPPECG